MLYSEKSFEEYELKRFIALIKAHPEELNTQKEARFFAESI